MGPREIDAIVWLVIYVFSSILALYNCFNLKNTGVGCRQMSFISLLVTNLFRVGSFTAEIVFAATGQTNIGAVTASLVLLSAGFFGLIDCTFRTFEAWARYRLNFTSRVFTTLRYVPQLSRLAMALTIAGGAIAGSNGTYSSGMVDNSSTAQQLVQAGVIMFLAFSVLLTLFVLYGICVCGFDGVILALFVCCPFMLCRATFTVVGAFDFDWSIINFATPVVRLAIPIILMEFVVVVAMQALALWVCSKAKAGTLRGFGHYTNEGIVDKYSGNTFSMASLPYDVYQMRKRQRDYT